MTGTGGAQLNDSLFDTAWTLGRIDDAIKAFRPFVMSRLGADDERIDDILQDSRVVVWQRFETNTHRPSEGTLVGFVHGVIRNKIFAAERASRRERAHVVRVPDDGGFGTSRGTPEAALWKEIQMAAEDPFGRAEFMYDARRLVRSLAEFISEEEWDRVVTLAFADGTDSEVAEKIGVGRRSMRTTRERVKATALTVRAAQAAADEGKPASLRTAIDCVPDMFGVQSVLPHLHRPFDEVARELGIHEGTARARLAAARRLVAIAHTVLAQEVGE